MVTSYIDHLCKKMSLQSVIHHELVSSIYVRLMMIKCIGYIYYYAFQIQIELLVLLNCIP